jgi:hypothetical protein
LIWNLCKAALRQHVSTLQHDVLVAEKIANVASALDRLYHLHRSTGIDGKTGYPLMVLSLAFMAATIDRCSSGINQRRPMVPLPSKQIKGTSPPKPMRRLERLK